MESGAAEVREKVKRLQAATVEPVGVPFKILQGIDLLANGLDLGYDRYIK
jgi:hypothetical protein